MNFFDSLKSKFKKVDESELNRLRHAPPSCSPEKSEAVAGTPLSSIRPARSKGPTTSVTRLRAFIKQKSPAEIEAEDAARSLANERFTDRAMNDQGNEG